MINAIEILGYQSHKETILEFHPRVNYIIGESDIGKSAIIRALRWLFENTPAGDGFRNWDLKANELVRVAAEFSDGEWIAREKGKLRNAYQTSLSEDDFKAIRMGVPPEVFEVSKINDINIQRQQSWFLLDEKSGAVARRFNELADLQIMDAATSVVNAKIREVKGKKSALAEIVNDKQIELLELNKWLRPALVVADDIEKIDTKLQDTIQYEQELVALCNQIDHANERIKSFGSVDEAIETLAQLRSEFIKDLDLRQKRTALAMLKESVGTVRKQLSQYADTSAAERALKSLQIEADKLAEMQLKKANIKAMLIKWQNLDDLLAEKDDFIKKTEKVINSILKRMGICPTCGQEVK